VQFSVGAAAMVYASVCELKETLLHLDHTEINAGQRLR
jgi:hypothetical protein